MSKLTNGPTMKTKPILLVITIGIGILIGILIDREGSTSTNNTAGSNNLSSQDSNNSKEVGLADLQRKLEDLSTALQREREERILLSQQISTLVTHPNQTGKKLIKSDTANDDGNKSTTITTAPRPPLEQNDGWINATLLLSAGVDENTVQKIVQVYENVEMEKLYLRDTAVREGWTGTPRFREEMRVINNRANDLRSSLDETDYDAFLFATGKPNRVTVLSSLGNSPAAQAGIKPGDIILKYDDTRIYSWGDLRGATATGDKESMVRVEVDRNGERLEFYVKRGPLGVRLDHLSINPKG